jgi:hypothetical protein
VCLLKVVGRDFLVFLGLNWLFDRPWSDGFGSSLGHCDPRFARTASWHWRLAYAVSGTVLGRAVCRFPSAPSSIGRRALAKRKRGQ